MVPQLSTKPFLRYLKSKTIDAIIARMIAVSNFAIELPIKIKNSIHGKKLFMISFKINYLKLLSTLLHHINSALEISMP